MVPMLRNIAEEEGIAGLFKGLVPRMMKVSVSCAIMISFYEAGKRMSVRSPEMFVSNSSATSLSSADADEILVAVENE